MIDSRVDGAQYHRQGLVDEDEDEGDLREVSGVADFSTSESRMKSKQTAFETNSSDFMREGRNNKFLYAYSQTLRVCC